MRLLDKPLVSKVKKEPSLTFEIVEGGRWYGVDAYHMDVKVGEIRVGRHEYLPSENPDPHTPCYQVSSVEVAEPMRRRGVATALYLAAAEISFSEGFSLCSDEATSLNEEAEAVWESLSWKGIAYWEVPGGIDENFDYGRYVIPKLPTRKS